MAKVGSKPKVTAAALKKKSAAKKKTAPKKTGAAAATDTLEKSSPAQKAAAALKAETAASALDELQVSGVFPIDALGSISTASAAGQVFRLDSGFVDALRVQVRRFTSKDDKPGYLIEFKVGGPARKAFAKRLEKLDAKTESFTFYNMDAKSKKSGKKSHTTLKRTGATQALSSSFYNGNTAPSTSTSANLAHRLEEKNWTLEYIPDDGPIALRGTVRIEVRGNDKQAGTALKAAVNKAGLQHAFAPPTAASLDRYAQMKLLWRTAPAAAKKLVGAKKDLANIKLPDIKAALKSAKVSAARIKGLRYEEVAPGHFTVLDDGACAEMKKAGLKFAYSTVSSTEHVLSILQGGQKATLTRWSEGALIAGMSSSADVGTGGAQGVFSRIVVPEADKKSWAGRTYKIILKPELFARLDIWGWDGDKYGRSWDLGAANFGKGLVKSVRTAEGKTKASESSWASGTHNEIISPVGNGVEFIECVVATSAEDKKKLIAYLKKAKFKPANGQTLEKFVRFEPKIRADLLG